MMIGTLLCVRKRLHTSRPSSFGSMTSRTTRSTSSSPKRRSASSPSRLDDAVAVSLQGEREQLLDRLLVVHEKDGRGVLHRFVSAGPGAARRLTIAPAMKRLVRAGGGSGRAAAPSSGPERPSRAGCVDRRRTRRCWPCCSPSRRPGPYPGRRSTRSSTARRLRGSRRSSRSSIRRASPGTPDADDAAIWYSETIAGLGLETEEDVWETDVPELGDVQLRTS